MAILADALAASLHPFVTDNVQPGTTVITDGVDGLPGHRRSATRTTGAADGLRAPAATTLTPCCPESTASRPWPSGGRSAPTRVGPRRRTCPAT